MEHLYPDKLTAEILEFADEPSLKKWIISDLQVLLKNASIKSDRNVYTWVDDSRFLGGVDEALSFSRTFLGSPSSSSLVPSSPWCKPDLDQPNESYQYDVVAIGGGSGGIAFSKRAARLGANVAMLDFVKPSPYGTKWGLGGTCVNVGCIPKKLMHTAALVGESMHKSGYYGFGPEGFDAWPKHDWGRMVQNVQDYIHSLNFGYRVQMRDEKVTYLNKLAKFIDPHTIEAIDTKGEKTIITARRFLICVGGRPRPLGCAGESLAISSDDIFSLAEPPGKTLVVGASYVALECAGFLHGLGYPVKVMVRSILLRGFDRDMSERVGGFMKKQGVEFIEGASPTKLEKLENGKIRVYWVSEYAVKFLISYLTFVLGEYFRGIRYGIKCYWAGCRYKESRPR